MQHRDNAMFGAVQWFFWSGFGLIFAFLSAYYQEIGFTSVQIGLVMALVSVANIAGQPLLAVVSDRIGAPGVVLRNTLLVGVLLTLAMYWVEPRLLPVALLSVLVSATIQTLPPILDGWIMQIRERVPRLDYGLSRSMGSVGFALTVAIAGRVFDAHGIEWMFPGAAVALGITVAIVAVVQRFHGRESRDVSKPAVSHPSSASHDAFFSPQMIAVLVISFLTFTAFRPVQVFIPVLIRAVGGTNQDLGFSYSMMAVGEVPFLIGFSFLIRRFRDTRVLFIALVFFFFRIAVHALPLSPTFIVWVQLLQGPSFGLFLPGLVHLLNRLAPAGRRTLAQTAGAIASFGLGSMSGSALGGYLVDWFGITTMYAIMAALMAGVVVAYFVLFIRPGVLGDRARPATTGYDGDDRA